jgi:hypothetical protein
MAQHSRLTLPKTKPAMADPNAQVPNVRKSPISGSVNMELYDVASTEIKDVKGGAERTASFGEVCVKTVVALVDSKRVRRWRTPRGGRIRWRRMLWLDECQVLGPSIVSSYDGRHREEWDEWYIGASTNDRRSQHASSVNSQTTTVPPHLQSHAQLCRPRRSVDVGR